MRKSLGMLVLFVVVFNLLSIGFIFYRTERALETTTAQAMSAPGGRVDFCINQPPSLSVPCNATLVQYQPYLCQINASDSSGSPLAFVQVPQPPDNSTYFNISPGGLINFTPYEAAVGNHSVILFVDDGSGCDNSLASVLFPYQVQNVNDPPYLSRVIPDQSLNVNATLVAFSLRDFFTDPDRGDVLSFSYLRAASEISVNVTISADSSVTFYGTSCGVARLIFTARDLGNLSATSNLVEVEVNCDEQQAGGGSETGEGSGGGGGGGGASSDCEPELVCLPWSECYPNGMQVQVCSDRNGCSDAEIKFYRNCTYEDELPLCDENWLCSEWAVCTVGGMQNRTCQDLAACGTARFLPPLEQQCLYRPRCDDGVQNGDETGIDCGGDCGPCKAIQQPSFFPNVRSLATLFTFLATLLLFVLLALFTLYRERVYEGLARLGWLLAPRKEKELLLSSPEKRTLFEDLALLEKDSPSLAPQKAYERLSILLRKYFTFALDVPFEYTQEEYGAALAAAKVSDELRTMLAGFGARLELLESGLLLEDGNFNGLLFSSVREELRLMVCMTSLYTVDEVSRELTTRSITPELTFATEIRARLLNAYEALQFFRSEIAEQEYLAILRAYENAPVKAKALLYADIQRLYLAIRYVAETLPDA